VAGALVPKKLGVELVEVVGVQAKGLARGAAVGEGLLEQLLGLRVLAERGVQICGLGHTPPRAEPDRSGRDCS